MKLITCGLRPPLANSLVAQSRLNRTRTTCSHLLHRCCRLRGAQKHENTWQTTHLSLHYNKLNTWQATPGPHNNTHTDHLRVSTITIDHIRVSTTTTDHLRVSTTWHHSWATTTTTRGNSHLVTTICHTRSMATLEHHDQKRTTTHPARAARLHAD